MSHRANHRSLADLVERYGIYVLGGLALFDLVVRAQLRFFWFDELLTYWIVRLPSLGAVWEGLLSGADPQPFPALLPFRVAHTVFGADELATRSVSILAFGLAAAGTYRFVRHGLGALAALAATLLLCLSLAYAYGLEARAYAMMIAATAWGLVSWRSAIEARPRLAPVSLFGLCMAVLVSTHYFACLVLVAFAVGELIRYYHARAIDWPTAAALLMAPLALVPYIPIAIRIRQTYQGYSWRTGELQDIWLFYAEQLAPAAAPLACSAVVGLAAWAWSSGRLRPGDRETGAFERHELWALATLALLPVGYVLSAKYMSNAYAPRYALSAHIGVACLFGAGLKQVLRGRALLAAICVTLLSCFVVLRVASSLFRLAERG